MAATAQILQPGLILSTTSATVFTAPAGTTVISSASLANPGTAAAGFSIQIKRASGTLVQIVPQRSLQSNATDLLPELAGRVLYAGDTVLASGEGLHLILDGYGLS